MKPFLKQLTIDETETLTSYLFRVFRHNYYEFPFGIFNNEFTKYEFLQNQINEDICKKLNSITGQYSLYHLSYKRLKIEPDKNHPLFLKNKAKLCPLCLKRKSHQHFLWGFNIVHVCMQHQVYLLKECNYCKKSFTIYSLFKNKCNRCGRSLSELKTKEVKDEWILNAQNELSELLLGRKEKIFNEFNLNDFLLVLIGFSFLFSGRGRLPFHNNVKSTFKYTHNILSSQEEFVFYLADLYWMFKEFDNRFPLLLEEVFKKERSRKNRRKRSHFEAIMKTTLNLNFIYERYRKHWQDNYIKTLKIPKNLVSYDEYAFHYIEENYFTANQVKRTFGITSKELRLLMEIDAFKECFIDNGNAVYFYKDKTIKFLNSFLMEKNDRVKAPEAAELLGVTIDRVRDLKNNGLLDYFQYLDDNKCYSKEQINQLLKSLKVQITNNHGSMISIERCFDKFATSGLSLQQLISFIRDKQLVAYALDVPYKIRDLWFNANEIASRLEEERIYTKGYNLKQVSQILNCTERTVLKYVNAGLIGCPVIERLNNKAFAYRFNQKDIQYFKENFLTMEEVVKKFNVSASLVRNAIHRGTLKNYVSGICRKTVIRRQEFEDYRAKRTTTGTAIVKNV